MKVKKFNKLQLRKIELPVFAYSKTPITADKKKRFTPLENNLDLKAFIKKGEKEEFTVGLILRTLETNKSKWNLNILALFHFTSKIALTGEREGELPYVSTALSVAYSTLRGILIQKAPELGMLPLVSIPDLLKALEEGIEEFFSNIQ